MFNEEFWTALLAIVVDLAVYLCTYFLAPEWAEFAKVVIAAITAIALLLIGTLAAKKVAAIRAGTFDSYVASRRL